MESDIQIATGTNRTTVGYNAFSRFDTDPIIVYDRSPSTMGMSQSLFTQFRRVMEHISKTHEDEDVKYYAGKLQAWDFQNEEAVIPSLEASAKMHIPEKAPDGYEAALYKGSVVDVHGDKEKPYFAKVLDVMTHEGQIFYGIEEFSGVNQWSQGKRGGTVRRSIPSDKVQIHGDHFHIWGMVNMKTGKYAPHGMFGNAPKLQPKALTAA